MLLELICVHQDQGARDAIRTLSVIITEKYLSRGQRCTGKYSSSGLALEMFAHYYLELIIHHAELFSNCEMVPDSRSVHFLSLLQVRGLFPAWSDAPESRIWT